MIELVYSFFPFLAMTQIYYFIFLNVYLHIYNIITSVPLFFIFKLCILHLAIKVKEICVFILLRMRLLFPEFLYI